MSSADPAAKAASRRGANVGGGAQVDIGPIQTLLHCGTPDAWVEQACQPGNLPALLTDHANCERKAAESALATIKRYGASHLPVSFRNDLLQKMSRLAREELRHFEQVLAIIGKRKLEYLPLGAGRYAVGLRAEISSDEPQRLVDSLLVGGIIEARSCERFAALAPHLDPELASFYTSLLKSESRHFQDYLKLAAQISDENAVQERCEQLLSVEARLISEPDGQLRFHSGVPIGVPD